MNLVLVSPRALALLIDIGAANSSSQPRKIPIAFGLLSSLEWLSIGSGRTGDINSAAALSQGSAMNSNVKHAARQGRPSAP